jgi:short-subunit dehydrogenase
MRLELEPAGIYPVLVEPGPIQTAFRDNAIKQFDKWIQWDQSVWAKHYEKVRQPVRSKTNLHKFELPPSAVTEKIIHALEAKKPKARYYVTTPTYIMGWARRFLPTRMLDRLCKKI